jgi:hypothetical protein
MQSDNIDDRLRALGTTQPISVFERWDRSGDLGGRIVRDKLWFYGSARQRREAFAILGLFQPDGSPALITFDQRFFVTKFTYQMSPSQKLIGSNQYQDQSQDGSNASRFTEYPGSKGLHDTSVHIRKAEWQLAKGQTFVSLQTGFWWATGPVWPGFSDNPLTFDQVTSRVTGAEADAGTRRDYGRYDTKGTMNWYKSDLFQGNHDFKTGFNYFVAHGNDLTYDRGKPGNMQLIFRDSVPFQLVARNNPVSPENQLHYLAGFLQDSWTIGRRLTLNLGLRYAHDRAYLPDQCRVAAPAPFANLYPAECFPRIDFDTWNPVTPRLHTSYDMTGDGKTVLKGGWGRFATMHASDDMVAFNNNADISTVFRWHDINGDRLFQAGDADLSANGPDFVQRQLSINANLVGMVQNPDLKEPGSNEFSISLERQLMQTLALRVTGVYSRNFNTLRVENTLRPYSAYNVPITNPDPGPDGRVGTADDTGRLITYYDYPASLAGGAFQRPRFVNDSTADASFKSFEIAASRRLSGRWQLLASFSATKSHIPFVPDLTGNQKGVFSTSLNPNAEIFTTDNTWEWTGHISGSYLFPAGIQFSANYVEMSGMPWARTVTFTGGRQVPSITLRVEPIGTQRLESAHLLNLRVEKSLRLKAGHAIGVRAQVYNALNGNWVASESNPPSAQLITLSGPNYLKPSNIARPRIGEFAVTYTF